MDTAYVRENYPQNSLIRFSTSILAEAFGLVFFWFSPDFFFAGPSPDSSGVGNDFVFHEAKMTPCLKKRYLGPCLNTRTVDSEG